VTATGASKRNTKTRSIILAAIIVVALVVSAGYYYTSVSNSNKNNVTVNITIVGGDTPNSTDTYSPDNFTVTLNQHVTLVVLNTDDNTHGLVIPQFSVDTGIIQGGASVREQFVANKVGTFQFYEPAGYCTGGVGNVCNSIQQMTGTMTVVP